MHAEVHILEAWSFTEEERKLETSCQRGRIKETFKLGYSIGALIFRTKRGEPK